MVPQNSDTGRPDRHLMSEEEVLAFRKKQALLDEEGPEGPEGSGDSPSPLAGLSAFREMSLDAGPSPVSLTNTPGDSPAILPPVPLPEFAAPAPLSALETRGASKSPAGKSAPKPSVAAPAQHSAGFAAEAPGPSNLLTPEYRPQRSHGEASPVSDASDDRMSAARIATLEQRVGVLESRQNATDLAILGILERLKSLGV